MTVMVEKRNPWGAKLKKLRKSKGISQPHAAKLIGVPVATYRNWEQGRTCPLPFVRKLIESSIRALPDAPSPENS